jgi:cell division transport system permease protein
MKKLGLLSRAISQMKEDLWLQAVAISTLSLCLFVMGAVLVSYYSLDGVLSRVGAGAGLKLVLRDDVSPEQGQSLTREIESWAEVKSSNYVSPEVGLIRLRNSLGQTGDLLEGLEGNPLPAVIEMQLNDESEDITRHLQRFAQVAEVIEARPWLQRLVETKALLKVATMAVGVVLFLALALIVTNTVRLAVYARREHLAILDMLGASRLYMRGPFIVESMLQALMAAVISSLLLAACLKIIPLFPETPLWLSHALPLSLPWLIPFYLAAITILAGLIGSWLGVGRALRLPEPA